MLKWFCEHKDAVLTVVLIGLIILSAIVCGR